MLETLDRPSVTFSDRDPVFVVDDRLKSRLRQFTTEGTNAFISYTTRLASNPEGTVADVSHMQVWKGDQATRRNYVEKILERYRDRYRVESYGEGGKKDKFLVFIEEPEDYTPRHGLERLLEVQRIPIDHLPQDIDLQTYKDLIAVRERELLDGEEGSWYTQVAEGSLDSDEVPGVMQQTGFSNVWGWKNQEDGLVAKGPDGTPFDIRSLARDPETKQMVDDKFKFLTSGAGKTRSILEICIAADTGACGGETERKKSANDWVTNIMKSLQSGFAGFSSAESGIKYCTSCSKWVRPGECDCEDEE